MPPSALTPTLRCHFCRILSIIITISNFKVYALNLSESGHDMPLVASLPVEQRYHKLVWGGGAGQATMPSGLLVGGADRGVISM